MTEPMDAPDDGQVDAVEDAEVQSVDDAEAFAADGMEGAGAEGVAATEADGMEGAGAEARTALPPKIEAWRRRSATGAILTGFALGLQKAFEPPRDEPAIVMQTSGDPPKDLPVEAELEQVPPRHTVVKVRPWLLPGADPDQPADGDGSPRGGSN